MNMRRKSAVMKSAFVSLLVVGLIVSLWASPFIMRIGGDMTVISPIKSYGVAADPSVGVWKNFTTLHDTDNLYGGNYYTYQFTTNITDSDGNISNCTLWFELEDSTKYYGLKYDNASNAFSEYYNASYGVESSSAVVGRGTTDWLNITWKFTITWTHPDIDNLRVCVGVYDGDSTIHQFNSSVTYDFDTDVTLTDSTFFTYTVYEQLEHAGTCSLTFAYEDSGGDNYPLAAQTDFHASRAAVESPLVEARSWEADSYSDSTGVASWTTITMSETEAGGHTETWSFVAVSQGDGATGTSVLDTTYTETVEISSTPPPPDRPTRDAGDDLGIDTELLTYAILFGGMGLFTYYWYVNHSVPKSRGKSKGKRGKRKSRKRKR